MTKQPEALELADSLCRRYDLFPKSDEFKAAAELRRLHDVNAELLAALKQISDIKNEAYGPDWEEITVARKIARVAIRKVNKTTGKTE